MTSHEIQQIINVIRYFENKTDDSQHNIIYECRKSIEILMREQKINHEQNNS